jgi:hypothetical protein
LPKEFALSRLFCAQYPKEGTLSHTGFDKIRFFGRMYSETGELADGWRGSGKDRIER